MNIDKAVEYVVKNFKEDDWINEIKSRVDDSESDGSIIDAITAYFGGDVVVEQE